MSLDVKLLITQPTVVYSANITHNLAKMAGEVKLKKGLTLYNVLWRPDECDPPLTKASEIADLLDDGYWVLLSDPDYFKQFNPKNGWGSYDSLVKFVDEYRSNCFQNPDADIGVCR